jgi:SpoVK/Ycf46/Vps4 family AAA+-type ATPase
MFKTHLGTKTLHTIRDNEWMQLAQRAEQWVLCCIEYKIIMFNCSYSGADIAVVCREALLRPIRRLCSSTHFKRVSIHQIFCLNYFDSFHVGTKSKWKSKWAYASLACLFTWGS